jgi:hypothetical protein
VWRRWVGGLLGLVACSNDRWLPIPLEGPVAYLYQTPDQRRWLASESQLPARFEIDGEQPLYALGYLRPLEELQLSPGPLPITELTAEGRPLPRPEVVVQAVLEGGGGWGSADPEALRGLAVPNFDPVRCLQIDRCVDAEPSCIPCPLRTPPQAPALPELPCPSGWVSEVGPRGITLCHPNEPAALPCGSAELQLVGRPSCESLAACAPGDWPERRSRLPPLYVRALAAGGDGSSARPFGTIGEAWASTDQPREVLLADGVYAEPVSLDRPGWILNGHCPSQVVLQNDAGPSVVATSSATVIGVSLEGAEPLRIEVNAQVRLEGVRIGAGAGDGVVVRGQLTARRLLIEGRETDGLLVEPGGSVNLEESNLRNSGGSQVSCRGGAVRGVDLRLAAQEEGPSCETYGLSAFSGCQVELQRLVVEGFCKTSLRALDLGTHLTLERGVVRNNRSSLPSEGGGFSVFGGSSVLLRTVAFQRVLKDALQIVESQLRAEDLLVEETQASDDYSYGVFAGEDSNVALVRAVLRSNDVSDLLSTFTSSVTLEDVVVLPKGDVAYPRVSTDQLVARRVYVGAAPLVYMSAQARLELSDLTLEGGDLEAAYLPSAQIARVRTGGAQRFGLRITPRVCGVDCRPMVLSDLLFEGLPTEAIGVDVESVLATELERFEVHGGAYGLRLRDGLFELRDGLIDGAKAGVWIPTLPADPDLAFGELQMTGVETKVLLQPID